MNHHAVYALTYPLRDPDRDIRVGHYWRCARRASACLTVTHDRVEPPYWQLSISHTDANGPVPRSLWTAAWWDDASQLAQYILGPLGEGVADEIRAEQMTITRQWRKPLSLAEINKIQSRGHGGAS